MARTHTQRAAGQPQVCHRGPRADAARRWAPAALMSVLPGGARVYTHRRHGRAAHRQALAWVGDALADLEEALSLALGVDAADTLARSPWQAGLRIAPVLPGQIPPPVCADARGLYSDRHAVLWLRTRASLAHEVAHYLDQTRPLEPDQGHAPVHSLGERALWVEAMAATNVVRGRQSAQQWARLAPDAAQRAAAAHRLRAYDALLAQFLGQGHLVASWEVFARGVDQYLAASAATAGRQPRCCRPVVEYATLPEFWSDAALHELAPRIRAALVVRLEALAGAGVRADQRGACGGDSRATASHRL
jgi:hypothetical protein